MRRGGGLVGVVDVVVVVEVDIMRMIGGMGRGELARRRWGAE